MATSAVALAESLVASAPWRVGLIGNPNTGKTTIFNRLCGARAKTSNFPGTTTMLRRGRSELGPSRTLDLLDLPGVYALALECPESRIARSVIEGRGPFGRPDAMVVLVDACNLTRNLILVAELLQHDVAVIVALNMADLARCSWATCRAWRTPPRSSCVRCCWRRGSREVRRRSMTLPVQDVLVTLAAAGCAAAAVRRVIGAGHRETPRCASCNHCGSHSDARAGGVSRSARRREGHEEGPEEGVGGCRHGRSRRAAGAV